MLSPETSSYRALVPPRKKSVVPITMPELRVEIRRGLLAWYKTNRRALPWRDAPTPYQVWVSEVMLQQTRVEVVRDYYARFMESFPDLASLARASEDKVLSLWQGLGYYSRARRLLSGARFVEQELEGKLPESPDELQKIPGIGPYSAGAISSIAFGRPSPIVDGNVIRVLARLFALSGDPGRAPLKEKLWTLSAELVPQKDAAHFNQALMELGALVCTPTSPACHACPLRKKCQAHQTGQVARFPELPKRAKPTELVMVVAIIQRRGKIAVEKLPPGARWWAGLHAFPFGEIPEGQKPGQAARVLSRSAARVSASEVRVLPTHKHAVTRFKISLIPVLLEAETKLAGEGRVSWVTKSALGQLALPAPHRKVLEGISW